MPYDKGLHELGDACFAYLQPDGSWGWSNAGLVVGDGASLLVDTLFDLRLTAEMLDAMAPSHDRRADRHAAQHPRQRRPLLRQPAGRRCGDRRVGGDRARDVRSAAGDAARAEHGAGRGRRAVPSLLRRVRLRRHRRDDADPHVQRSARRGGRRASGRADRGRPGAHARRHHRLRARREDGLHRRHPVHRRHAHRVGRPAVELGGGVRPDAGHGHRHRRARPRSAHRQGRRRGRCATTSRSSTAPPAHVTPPASTRGTRPATSRARSAPARSSAAGASSVASRQRRHRVPLARPGYVAPNVVEQFRRMAELEGFTAS